MKCFIVIEKTNSLGEVTQKTYNPLSFSWILPEDIRQLASETGFEIADLYGDFEFGSFNKDSKDQIWVLQKPS